MTYCGYCGAPTLNGALCKTHWRELLQLLRRCEGLSGDLASAVGKRGRYGEDTGSGSSGPSIPINVDAMDAGRELQDALYESWRHLGLVGRPSTVDDAARSILIRQRRLQGSAAAPVLLGHLVALVPAAVRMTDKPKGRVAVRGVPCPRCAGGPLQPVMGSLRCDSCRELSTIGEVRAAS